MLKAPMENQEPIMTSFYGVPLGADLVIPDKNKNIARAASREASEREMAYMRALSAPPSRNVGLPPIKSPNVSQDFTSQIASLDNTIFERGVAVDRAALVGLGQARFQDLLKADYAVKQHQRVGCNVDLTSWPEVKYAFQQLSALRAAAVPPRKSAEIAYGHGIDREQAAAFNEFADLWKAFGAGEPECVRNCLAFYDTFASLAFGVSLLDRLANDGRVHSHCFTGGSGNKVALFDHWREVVRGSLLSVTLPDALWHVVTWLSNERQTKPDTRELARAYYNTRLPSSRQVQTVEAVLAGVLLGHTGWSLWEFVGGVTHTSQPPERLAEWRNHFVRSCPGIARFHDEIKAAFYKPVGMNAYEAHQQFDAAGHRAFIDKTVQGFLNLASAVASLAIESVCSNALVARFQTELWLETKKPPRNSLRGRIEASLSDTFPGSTFTLQISEGSNNQ